MILSYAFCNIPVLPVRKEPFHSSEQTSQLLFGEKAWILEVNEREWARIRCFWDDYEGWCKLSQLNLTNKKVFNKENRYLTARQSEKLVFDQGEMWLPLGAELHALKGRKVLIGNDTGRFKGKKLDMKKTELTGEQIKAAAFQYLYAPYQWGGRTVAGIDCSGLVQMAYKLCNKKLPRDTTEQVAEGETVDFLQHAECGDLAFFNNDDGKINHVGIILDESNIIHATDSSGRVVTDKIDQGGIISTTLRKRTHSLRVVKRIIQP